MGLRTPRRGRATGRVCTLRARGQVRADGAERQAADECKWRERALGLNIEADCDVSIVTVIQRMIWRVILHHSLTDSSLEQTRNMFSRSCRRCDSLCSLVNAVPAGAPNASLIRRATSVGESAVEKLRAAPKTQPKRIYVQIEAQSCVYIYWLVPQLLSAHNIHLLWNVGAR